MLNKNTTFIFIDASNLWEAQKAKGKLFDFEKLKKFLKEKFDATAIEFFYYSAYPAEGTRDYSTDDKHKFFTFLKKGLGFIVRKKELKRINVITEVGQSVEEKGNMDVEITIDSLHHIKKYDTAVFFSGDSDFLALVAYLRRRGKKVFIFSSENNISRELRTGANGYFDILKIENNVWGKDLKHRTDKSTRKQSSPPQGGLP
ncbi:NYN domain-containing protein [Candidatus Wolfebacteria bacterium]|nr:NYN domain-containing protein [Candidatus Wolfebacteria bacterium]